MMKIDRENAFKKNSGIYISSFYLNYIIIR